MSALRHLSGQQCVNALQKAGFVFRRQDHNHIVLRRNDPFTQLVVPDHTELDRRTPRAILRQAEISIEEFISLLPPSA
jgi:predicted RNA binding protein YcfA (HicA-like mRNA interferase family)